jgi:hypothetical protein
VNSGYEVITSSEISGFWKFRAENVFTASLWAPYNRAVPRCKDLDLRRVRGSAQHVSVFPSTRAKSLVRKHGTLPTVVVKVFQHVLFSLKNKLMKLRDTAELTHHVVDP